MSNEASAVEAVNSLVLITQCLERAKVVAAEHQSMILDLKTIVAFQQERIVKLEGFVHGADIIIKSQSERLNLQANAIAALQAMCRNLDERIKGERSLSA